jgi:hypothetical protein
LKVDLTLAPASQGWIMGDQHKGGLISLIQLKKKLYHPITARLIQAPGRLISK